MKNNVGVDNLNTHTPWITLRNGFPEKAKALWDNLEFVYTPKNENWLNMAELELNVFPVECLNRRIIDVKIL